MIEKNTWFYNKGLANHIMDTTDIKIKKALVAFAIEKALLDVGDPVFQKVTKALKNDYDCYIPDCYEHPEYLKRILSDLYGNAHTAIIGSIKNNLQEFTHHEPIQKFVSLLD
jgi:hypothetical protein